MAVLMIQSFLPFRHRVAVLGSALEQLVVGRDVRQRPGVGWQAGDHGRWISQAALGQTDDPVIDGIGMVTGVTV
ncbi:hypothetical protein IWGMT90018_54350 [Mycobacterium kiyosense]|nr:hypothetical protein IWGMT90018_54350 [Mycobacterium kiyosense]